MLNNISVEKWDMITLADVIKEAETVYPEWNKSVAVGYFSLILNKTVKNAVERERRERAAEKLKLLSLLFMQEGQNN